jgi:hypothetical protein
MGVSCQCLVVCCCCPRVASPSDITFVGTVCTIVHCSSARLFQAFQQARVACDSSKQGRQCFKQTRVAFVSSRQAFRSVACSCRIQQCFDPELCLPCVASGLAPGTWFCRLLSFIQHVLSCCLIYTNQHNAASGQQPSPVENLWHARCCGAVSATTNAGTHSGFGCRWGRCCCEAVTVGMMLFVQQLKLSNQNHATCRVLGTMCCFHVGNQPRCVCMWMTIAQVGGYQMYQTLSHWTLPGNTVPCSLSWWALLAQHLERPCRILGNYGFS